MHINILNQLIKMDSNLMKKDYFHLGFNQMKRIANQPLNVHFLIDVDIKLHILVLFVHIKDFNVQN
jgi:hypothetical protein